MYLSSPLPLHHFLAGPLCLWSSVFHQTSLAFSTPYILCNNCLLYLYKSFSFSISLSTWTLFLRISYTLIHNTAHTLLPLCRHFMMWFAVLLCMHYRLFRFPDLNSASALSCIHCALTWFKFKLACICLANQMFCMIIYGWALSEIKGCCPFCLPVTGLCSPICTHKIVLSLMLRFGNLVTSLRKKIWQFKKHEQSYNHTG